MAQEVQAPRLDAMSDLQGRVLSLEIELRQRLKHGYITQAQFKKRSQEVAELKELLSSVPSPETNYSVSAGGFAEDAWPIPSQLSPDEHKLYLHFLKDHQKLLVRVCKEAINARGWVKKVIDSGGFGLATIINLSFLRKGLVRLESWTNQQNYQREDIDTIARNVIESCQALTPTDKKVPVITGLQRILKRLEELDVRILKKHGRIQKEREELQWKTEWIAAREVKFAKFIHERRASSHGNLR